MVAYAQPQANRLRPMDTGAIFDGRVRIWVLTDNPLQAANLGAHLHKLGLPLEPQLIQKPTCMGVAIRATTAAGKHYLVILETDDGMDAQRFVNWLHQKNLAIKEPAPKPDERKSLSQLADEGVIETIE